VDTLLDFDKNLFLGLNGFHADWLDPVMITLTRPLVWLPFYLVLLYFTVKSLGKDTWIFLGALTITLVAGDQITSGLMKPLFERLRPSHEPALQGMVHLVDGYRGGRFGFSSGHAANTLSVAVFFSVVLGNTHNWIWVLYPWAFLMAYTRIYLGVHYPGDIVAGFAVGVASAWVGIAIFRMGRNYRNRKQSATSSP
jgi:undecaprenyl-diphosphatase